MREVQVCGENESGEYDSAYARLARAGIRPVMSAIASTFAADFGNGTRCS